MFAKDEQTFMLKDHSGEKWYSLEEIRAKLEQGDCRAFLMVMQYTRWELSKKVQFENTLIQKAHHYAACKSILSR